MPNFDPLTYRYSSRRNVVYAKNGVCCTSVPLGAQVGLDVLKNGGNAVDAAVAMAGAMPLLEPTGNGLGSDCFALAKNIDSGFQAFVNVLGSSYFSRNIHSCFLLHFFQPGKTLYTDSFETSRFGTWFPDSGTEYFLSFGCQLSGGIHYLFFSLCATWAGDDDWYFGFYAR